MSSTFNLTDAGLTMEQAWMLGGKSETLPGPDPEEKVAGKLDWQDETDPLEEHIQSQSTEADENHKSNTSLMQRKVQNAFRSCVASKCIVILTADPHVKSVLKQTFLNAAATLFFVKTSMELLHAIGDHRNEFHTIFIDLGKANLKLSPILKTIHGHHRYRFIPIVAIATSRVLPETVTTLCCYVVFKPVAPVVVREAIVWCLDRKTLLKLQGPPPADGNSAHNSSMLPVDDSLMQEGSTLVADK